MNKMESNIETHPTKEIRKHGNLHHTPMREYKGFQRAKIKMCEEIGQTLGKVKLNSLLLLF